MPTSFAQKFTTTFITGGCRIHVQQDNPDISKGTIPTSIVISLYTWNTDYTTTTGGTPLVTEKAIIASEDIEDCETWVFAFWKPLSTGTYLWEITVQTEASDSTGTFRVLRDSESTYHDAYEGDGTNVTNVAWDFHSYIMGLGSETYERLLSFGDTFTGSYATDIGHANPQVNRGTTTSPNYVNSIYAQDAVMLSGRKVGRIGSGSLVKLN